VIRNNGISFGLEVPWVVIALIFGVLVWWWYKEKDWRLVLVIIGGGLNLWERITQGYVTDYWIIPGTNIYNNLNDWLIFIGVVLYIWKKLK